MSVLRRSSAAAATPRRWRRWRSQDAVELVVPAEQLEGVLAERPQHREPRLAVLVRLVLDEAGVEERLERVGCVEAGAERLDEIERAAACEHAERAEGAPLVVAEQPVAPVDRRPHRLLTLGDSGRRAP